MCHDILNKLIQLVVAFESNCGARIVSLSHAVELSVLDRSLATLELSSVNDISCEELSSPITFVKALYKHISAQKDNLTSHVNAIITHC